MIYHEYDKLNARRNSIPSPALFAITKPTENVSDGLAASAVYC